MRIWGPSFKGTYHLKNRSAASGRSIFIIRDMDDKVVGEIRLGTANVIDPKKRQGAEGKCKWPVMESYPSRIVLDRGHEEEKFQMSDAERKVQL